MGLYDDLIVEYSIDAPSGLTGWQTKDLGQTMSRIRLSADGRLSFIEQGIWGQPCDLDRFRGEVRFYTYRGELHGDDYEWWEYSALFDNGQLLSLRRLEPKPDDADLEREGDNNA